MATIRKKSNGKWLAEVRVRKSYSSREFHSKIEAQSWAIDEERKRGRHAGKPIIKTLAQAMDRFSQEISPTHKGTRWEQIRIEKLKRDPVTDIVLPDLSTEDLQNWVDKQETSGSTVRREFNIIRSTLTISRKKWKWLSHEPQRDVTLPKSNPSRSRRLKEGELQRLLDALEYSGREVRTIRQQIAVACLLALETAMRQGEIWGLEWSRVHLEQRYVTLADTKNGTSRDVPLSTKAVTLLESMPKPHKGRVIAVPQATAGVIFRRACELAAIKGLHFHDLRHEAITMLARKLSMLELARMVGHKDPRSLSIYYNATATELAAKLD